MKQLQVIFLPMVSLLIGVLLALLRSWQLRENGLSFGMLLLALAAAALLWLLCSRLPSGGNSLSGVRSPVAGILFLLGGLLMAVCSVLTLYERVWNLPHVMSLFSDLLGLAAGLVCCVLGAAVLSGKSSPPLLRSVVYVFLILRLVSDFRIWTIDPVITDYCFRHFALILSIFAFYCSTSLAFGRGHRQITALWCMAGTGLCIMAACGVAQPESLLYLSLALLLIAQLV